MHSCFSHFLYPCIFLNKLFLLQDSCVCYNIATQSIKNSLNIKNIQFSVVPTNVTVNNGTNM